MRVHGALGTMQFYTGAEAVPINIKPANDAHAVFAQKFDAENMYRRLFLTFK
jgi:hypothetical protein